MRMEVDLFYKYDWKNVLNLILERLQIQVQQKIKGKKSSSNKFPFPYL